MTLSISPILITCLGLFSSLVSGQTYSDCNPMLQSGCPLDPALPGIYSHTFGPEFDLDRFKYLSGKNMITYGGPGGANFTVAKSKDSPTIVSKDYIMWGKFEVTMKAAPGAGIVSSLVLQSDDLDEIDWEWLGGKPAEAQSNYFGKGNTDTYDRGRVHPVSSQAQFHTYGMDWTAEKLDWTIDGVVVRTLTPAMVNGDFYPQTPMAARIGIWAGGDSGNEQGVIEWSGGPTDYKQGPFSMIVQSIYLENYSTGTAYEYTNDSGSSKSIKAIGGEIGVGPQPGAGNAASSSAAAKPTSGTSYNAPSNTGRLVSSTSKSEATPSGGSGLNADSTESTHNSASHLPSSSSPAGANYIATGGSTGTTETFAGAAASTMAATTAGMVIAAVGLVAGWML